MSEFYEDSSSQLLRLTVHIENKRPFSMFVTKATIVTFLKEYLQKIQGIQSGSIYFKGKNIDKVLRIEVSNGDILKVKEPTHKQEELYEVKLSQKKILFPADGGSIGLLKFIIQDKLHIATVDQVFIRFGRIWDKPDSYICRPGDLENLELEDISQASSTTGPEQYSLASPPLPYFPLPPLSFPSSPLSHLPPPPLPLPFLPFPTPPSFNDPHAVKFPDILDLIDTKPGVEETKRVSPTIPSICGATLQRRLRRSSLEQTSGMLPSLMQGSCIRQKTIKEELVIGTLPFMIKGSTVQHFLPSASPKAEKFPPLPLKTPLQGGTPPGEKRGRKKTKK